MGDQTVVGERKREKWKYAPQGIVQYSFSLGVYGPTILLVPSLSWKKIGCGTHQCFISAVFAY